MLTNILIAIIIYILIIISDTLRNINSKLLSNEEYLRLKKLSNGVIGPIIRKVKDEKKI